VCVCVCVCVGVPSSFYPGIIMPFVYRTLRARVLDLLRVRFSVIREDHSNL
jgi:hypothetical protein